MYKVGEQIVCLNNTEHKHDLQLYKSYIITQIIGNNGLVQLNHNNCVYGMFRFISLVEYRKQKIKKICSKLEIK